MLLILLHMELMVKKVVDIDSKNPLKEGPLQIRTLINNIKAEIRIFVKDGELINFDVFKGWSGEVKKILLIGSN